MALPPASGSIPVRRLGLYIGSDSTFTAPARTADRIRRRASARVERRRRASESSHARSVGGIVADTITYPCAAFGRRRGEHWFFLRRRYLSPSGSGPETDRARGSDRWSGLSRRPPADAVARPSSTAGAPPAAES